MIHSVPTNGGTMQQATFRLSEKKEMIEPTPGPVDHLSDLERYRSEKDSYSLAEGMLEDFKQFSKIAVELDNEPSRIRRAEEGWFSSQTIEKDYLRDAAPAKGVVVLENKSVVELEGKYWSVVPHSLYGELGTPFADQLKYDSDSLDLHLDSPRFPTGMTSLDNGGLRQAYGSRQPTRTYDYSKSVNRDVLHLSTDTAEGFLTFDYLHNTAHFEWKNLDSPGQS